MPNQTPSPGGTAPETQRWEEEARFFDEVAAAAEQRIAPMHPEAIRRYAVLKRKRFPLEYRYRVVGDLKGRRVLDVGCGDGVNAVMLAYLGAEVTGLDISPGAIRLAERRAEVNGVAERTHFVCSALETAELPKGTFDVIWIDAFLHHVIPSLDDVLAKLASCLKADGAVVISEPVTLWGALRALRLKLPVHTDATPDERPLEEPEIDAVRRIWPRLGVRYFGLLTRFSRFVIPNHTLETAAAWRRATVHGFALADSILLQVPFLRRLAGGVVMVGRR